MNISELSAEIKRQKEMISNERESKIEERNQFSMKLEEYDEKVKKLLSVIKNHHTILHSIRKLFLKKKVRVKMHNEVVFQPVGAVDVFRYSGGRLYLYGWVFDFAHSIRSLGIGYYHDGCIIAFHPCNTVRREDVGETLNNSAAADFGFEAKADIETDIALQVYVEYACDDGVGRMYLGELPNDPDIHRIMITAQNDAFSEKLSLSVFEQTEIAAGFVIDPRVYKEKTDVIVLVGYEFDNLHNLLGRIQMTEMDYRLILIDDKSMEKSEVSLLEKYVHGRNNVVFLQNTEKLGFAGSVNRGLKLSLERKAHAVLLNTDVEVPDRWLERMIQPIVENRMTGMATPFFNTGILCGIPDNNQYNKLFYSFSVGEVDRVFCRFRPKYTRLPFGTGFCMAINIDALKKVGLLDEKTFGKDYGVEVDWCLQAAAKGYDNVRISNLFVFHKQESSLAREDKHKLHEKQRRIIIGKYPEYDRLVECFMVEDPLRMNRMYAMAMLISMADAKTTLVFSHALGGGAESYLLTRKEKLLKSGEKCITVTYSLSEKKYSLVLEYKTIKAYFVDNLMRNLLNMVGKVDEILINNLVSYPSIHETLHEIIRFRNEQKCTLVMLLHDYFCFCPCVHLLDNNNHYCREASVEHCNSCIPENRFNFWKDGTDAGVFRKEWHDFLKQCDEITAFSYNSRSLLLKMYSDLDNIKVVPHTVAPLPSAVYEKTTNVLNIGILGSIDIRKGLGVISVLAAEAQKKDQPVHFFIIGKIDGRLEYDNNVTITGRYSREELPEIIRKYDIDVFLMPSVIPETFSYTTSEVICMEKPIVCFDIGAPAERVAAYEKGLVLPLDISAECLLDRITEFAGQFVKLKD